VFAFIPELEKCGSDLEYLSIQHLTMTVKRRPTRVITWGRSDLR
jgi:hypothetical protein